MSLKVSWVKQNENFAHSTYSLEKTKAENETVVIANQTNAPAPNSLPFPTAPQAFLQPSLPTHLQQELQWPWVTQMIEEP